MTRALLTTLVLAGLTQHALAQVDGEALAGDPVPPRAEDLARATDAAADLAPVPADGDDLAKAADATAEVATVPNPPDTGAAPQAARPSSDDIDLSSLGLDPSGAAFDDKLNLYGFADIGYTSTHFSRNPVILPQDARGFLVGNFNVYLAKNLMPQARALAEVRFTFLPNGSLNADGSVVNTTAMDQTDFGRPAQWGGIVIARAYVEYDVSDYLTVRAGRWLTPYGIWNIDHGSPVIIGVFRPYIIGVQWFPEHQTGLDLFGRHYAHGFKLDYHLTASNGRGDTEAVADLDNRLAFGGHLGLETPWGVKLGGSYYRGRYTGLPVAAGVAPETYLEAAYGGDAQFEHGALRLQAEVLMRDRHYEAGSSAASAAGSVPDLRDWGVYVQAAYRFDRLWNVMPYAFWETNHPGDHTLFSAVSALNVGLNFRPTPALVLKLQWSRPVFRDDHAGFLSGETGTIYSAQAAWVF